MVWHLGIWNWNWNLSDKKSHGLKETALALLEKRCADHIVDFGSGLIASSFQFIMGRVLKK